MYIRGFDRERYTSSENALELGIGAEKMIERYIRSFTAIDPDGAAHQIDYFQTFLVFTSTGGRSRRLGPRRFKCNGQLLRRHGRGQYEMDSAEGPVRLISKDPKAI